MLMKMKVGDEFRYKEFHVLFKVKNIYPKMSSMRIEALVFIPHKETIENYCSPSKPQGSSKS